MPVLHFLMERQQPCRLDTFLKQDCGVSRRQLARLKHLPDGMTCNGQPIRSIDTVKYGDCIRLHIPDTTAIAPNPELSVPLLFEDGDLLVFDKPAGMPVHPSLNHRMDTLGNAFAARYPELTFRPVHRLDRNTSGLVAVAKHPIAAARLHGQIRKTYLALACGMPEESGTITAPIGRVPDSLIARCVAPDGKPAVTHYRLLHAGRYALLALQLETGRTHQIRVHLSHIGCPLAGDDLYGGDCTALSRHALHCAAFDYTDTHGRVHRITSPLPEDMQQLTELPDPVGTGQLFHGIVRISGAFPEASLCRSTEISTELQFRAPEGLFFPETLL